MDDVAQAASDTVKEANALIKEIEGYIPRIIDFAFNLVIAIIMLIIGRLVIKLILKLINKFFARAKVEVSVQKFLDSLIKVVLYIILIIIVCGQVGIQTTSFLAVIGSIGLAIGLALQGSLSNFAGGVLLLLLKPFKVGDYIKNCSSGEEGTVSKIDLFYTSLITADNVSVIIPNGTLANNTIINSSTFDKRRMDINFSINFSSDASKVKQVVYDMLKEHKTVLKEEEIIVFVKDITQNQIIMEFRVWVSSSDFWDTRFEIMEKVKSALEENNIDMYQNQLAVNVVQVEK